MYIKFAHLICLLYFIFSLPCKAEHAIDHLKHISKYKIEKVDLSEVLAGNYEVLFPKLGRSKIVTGTKQEINTIYYALRDSSESYDPALLYPNTPIYSIIENDSYYIVVKINRPATVVVSHIEGVEIPEDPIHEGYFKIDNYSDFDDFQFDYILSLKEQKSHHPWIDEEIEIEGDLEDSEWKISRKHVDHRTKHLTFSVQRVPVLDKNTGDIYVKYNLSTKK